jgi:hypothetical protein
LFSVTNKIDQAFSSLLSGSENGSSGTEPAYHVSVTEKVRIRSLVEDTRIAAVNAAFEGGHAASIQDLTDLETEDEDEEDSEEDDIHATQAAASMPLALSKIYKRTLEILGDSLATHSLPQIQDDLAEMDTE